MATIIKRVWPSGETTWMARVRRKGFAPITRTFDKKVHAEAWAKAQETDMNRNTYVDTREAESVTLFDALDRYKNEKTIHKKGRVFEDRKIEYLKKWPIAKTAMAYIKTSDIAKFRDERLKQVKPNTVKRELIILSHLFNTARREWKMDSLVNPITLISKPKSPQGRDRRLSPAEEKRLLKASRKSSSPWLEPMIILLLETAMRRGELLSLSWQKDIFVNREDVKTSDGKKKRYSYRYALLRDTKNGEARKVPLSPKAVSALAQLRRMFPESSKVIPFTGDGVKSVYQRILDNEGIEDLHIHDLRHEATSRLFERGLNMMQVASITGHKSLSMLKRYTHLRAEDIVKLLH